MKLKFVRSQFNYRMSVFFSIMITWLGFISLPFLSVCLIQILPNNISSNPLLLQKSMDYFFISIWIISGIAPFILLKVFWNKPKFKCLAVGTLFSTAMFIPSLIPLFLKIGSKPTASIIKGAILNTKLFFIVLMVSMGLFYLISLFLIKPLLQKSPWWAFLYAIPYMLVFLKLVTSYKQIDGLVKNKFFSYQEASNMLSSFPQEQLSSINPLQFDVMTFAMVNLIFALGGMLSVFIWQKTKNWRQKEKEKKESAF